LNDLVLKLVHRKTGKEINLDAYAAWKKSREAKGKAPVHASHDETTAASVTAKEAPIFTEPQSEIEKSIASTTVLSTTAGGDDSDAKLSYQQIVEMIRDGKEDDLPGIKDIPNTVLEGQGTASTQAQRRKPWEKAQPADDFQQPEAHVELSVSH
jgi:hypothetical protein